jgi:osmoprotectant transport system substrate-binding protein
MWGVRQTVASRRRPSAVVGALVAAALALAACGSSSGTSASASVKAARASGQITRRFDLRGVTLTVGSLDFTEELVMGWITVDALRAAGATVVPKLDLAGVDTIRQAELSGQIDIFPSYTGTGWIVYLNQSTRVSNPTQLFDDVNALDEREHHIAWIGPAPFNDTYDIATSERIAREYHLRTISDLAALVRRDPSVTTFCSTSSFAVRPDGLPGLEKAYGFTFPSGDLKTEARGLIYASLARGNPCNFGETYSTDARLLANHLVVLQDNKGFFPLYNGAETVRESVLAAHPAIRPLLELVLGRLTTPVVTQLNADVDLKGIPPQVVAADWLRSEGLT